MSDPDLHVTEGPGTVWRVGYRPDVWAWSPWEYATDSGLFGGRWDDQNGQFRTLYTGSSLVGCFLELLAKLQPSPAMLEALAQFEDDDGSGAAYPDSQPGAVGHSWLENREQGAATQTGSYCFITHSTSLAALRARFPFSEHHHSPADVDAALLKDARDRVLTRSVSRWVYDQRIPGESEPFDGIEFRSRMGDEIRLWAVFERPGDGTRSRCLTVTEDTQPVRADTPALREAFSILGLHWAQED